MTVGQTPMESVDSERSTDMYCGVRLEYHLRHVWTYWTCTVVAFMPHADVVAWCFNCVPCRCKWWVLACGGFLPVLCTCCMALLLHAEMC